MPETTNVDNTDCRAKLAPDWLTSDKFEEILQDVEDYDGLSNFRIRPAVATGENYMTTLLNARMDVLFKDGTTQEKSFMVKLMPNTSRQLVEQLKEWKVFEKESTVYSSYLPEFEKMYAGAGIQVKFAPHIYKSKHPSLPNEVLIMEDLRMRGFRNIKRQDGQDTEHTKKALEKLAQFHAASAVRFENRGPYPEMFDQCLCITEDTFQHFRASSANMLIECLPTCNCSHLAGKVKEYSSLLPDQFQAKSKLYPDEFHVLNHGDCWSNNIMFQYNDENGQISETYFVDYQMCRYGSPAHDLLYMLMSSTSLENKLKRFDYFISYYHEKLTKALRLLHYPRRYPTLRELHMALFRHGDWVYTVLTTIMPITLLDPTETADIDNLLDAGEKGNELRKLMYKSSRYIEHLRLLLPWMDNRGLLSYTAK